MHGRALYHWLPLLVVVLTATCVQAQETAVPEQPPPVQDQAGDCLTPCCEDQSIWFEAQWLWTMRSRTSISTHDFIGGPDATSFQDLPGFDGSSGERIKAAATFQGFLFEGVYTDWRGADAYLAKTLNGVAFNGGIAGDWIGRDFINSSTFFAPINSAATLTTPANTLGDQSGLGPSASFPNDPAPRLAAFYHSNFSLAEANVKEAAYTFDTFGGGLRWGVGFIHGDEDEVSKVGIEGTFRAVSNSGGATVSLPNSVLTQFPGAGLTLISGGGTGFSDGTGGSGVPSQLFFTQTAYTRNDLNGAQLLLDGDLIRFGRFTLGGKIQAGMFDNRASGDIIEVYGETNRDQSVYARELTNSRNRLAFLGGGGLSIAYNITDHFMITGGYDVVYVSGLALAPEQINGISGRIYEVQTNGSIFEQAAHVGLEFAY